MNFCDVHVRYLVEDETMTDLFMPTVPFICFAAGCLEDPGFAE